MGCRNPAKPGWKFCRSRIWPDSAELAGAEIKCIHTHKYTFWPILNHYVWNETEQHTLNQYNEGPILEAWLTDQEVVFPRAEDWKHHRNCGHRQTLHRKVTAHQPPTPGRRLCPILWCAADKDAEILEINWKIMHKWTIYKKFQIITDNNKNIMTIYKAP